MNQKTTRSLFNKKLIDIVILKHFQMNLLLIIKDLSVLLKIQDKELRETITLIFLFIRIKILFWKRLFWITLELAWESVVFRQLFPLLI